MEDIRKDNSINSEKTEQDSLPTQEEWVGKLRYEKSFSAKLSMADENVRQYYAIIATKLLTYDKVSNRTSWACETFSFHRARVARLSIVGKTLCLYLATDPTAENDGRYRVKDVSDVKKYEDTPSLLKVRSNGAARHAVQLIDKMAEEKGLSPKKNLPEPIVAENLPKDTFENLLACGQIRAVRAESFPVAEEIEAENEEIPEIEETTTAQFVGEEKTPKEIVASEEWMGRLRYEKSFLAKIALADDNVRQYYAMIASKLLTYDKVSDRTSWACETFSFHRARIARIAIVGKTLCLYLAIDPTAENDGKYRVKDVSDVKKYEDTPALLKVRSNGAARHAVQLIDKMAEDKGLLPKKKLPEPIAAESLLRDTFENLLARGLIRPIRIKSAAETEEVEETEEIAEIPPVIEEQKAEEIEEKVEETTEKTVTVTEKIVEKTDFSDLGSIYRQVLDMLLGGEGMFKVTKRYMLRSVDEMWVKALEDSLPALDTLTRNPTGFIAETEEVLPIEMTKKITGRSIQHLGQHANYLSDTGDGEYMPTKILNVFRDESYLTYENKFLNTLLSRLYLFVHRRAVAARKKKSEEESYALDYKNSFYDGDLHAKISLNIELSRKTSENAGKTVEIEDSLTKRIEKLDSVFSGYMTSPFVQQMGTAYIHPPISRTNAILKNKYFRQCLALWEFIESYNDFDGGVFSLAEDQDVSQELIDETYHNLTREYIAFKEAMRLAIEEDILLEKQADEAALLAAKEAEEETTTTAEVETEEGEGEEEIRGGKRYRKTFLANLILAGDEAKTNFAIIANTFLKYQRVKMRIGKWNCVFSRGRDRLARVEVRGKTIKLYLALNAAEEDEKYHLRDVSDVKKDEKTPALLRVRSDRAVKYAQELAEKIAAKFEIPLAKKPTAVVSAEDYPYRSREKLIEEGLIIVVGDGEVVHFTPKEIAAKIGEHIGEHVQDVQDHIQEMHEEMKEHAQEVKEHVQEVHDKMRELPEKIKNAIDEKRKAANESEAITEDVENVEVEEEEVNGSIRYKKTFLANLIMSEDETKENFALIANTLLGYDRVKMRIGKGGAVFNRGRDRLARMEVRGKSIKLFLALNVAEEDEKYHLRDVSEVKKNEKTPALLRVRSARSVKYAQELAAKLSEKYEMKPAKKSTAVVAASDYPYKTREELIEEGLIIVVGTETANGNIPGGFSGAQSQPSIENETPTAMENVAKEESGESDIAAQNVQASETETSETSSDLWTELSIKEEEQNRYEQRELSRAESDQIDNRLRELEKHYSDVPSGGNNAEAQENIAETAQEIQAVENVSTAKAAETSETAAHGEITVLHEETEKKKEAEDARQQDFPQIKYRVSSDYSNPNRHGVDDTKSFLKDEAAQEKQSYIESEREQKKTIGGFFRRLFSRKKNKRK